MIVTAFSIVKQYSARKIVL